MEWLTIMLFTIILVICGTYLIRICNSLIHYKKLVDSFPGPTPHPIIGSLLEYNLPREHFSTVFDERFKKYGGAIRVWNIPYLNCDIFISKPEFLEIVMMDIKHITKGSAYDRMHSWLGTGLLTSTGAKWHLHRKMITPAFHFTILDNFFKIFVEKSNTLVAKMRELSVDNVVDLLPSISRCTLDIICETAMGTQLNIQEDKQHDDYVSTVYELSELTTYRGFRPWLYNDFVFYKTSNGKRYQECLHVLHDFTEKVIEERKLQRLKEKTDASKENKSEDPFFGSKRRLALLDLLLETRDTDHPLTDLEIREEVDTFMFEGHDTTSMAISWSIYLLGRHPHIQDEVVKELEGIFINPHHRLTSQDLLDMKYLERVIKESLRLYPSVPFIARLIKEDLPLREGYMIPGGTNVTLDIFHTHRDPTHFPDPETFNPDNFLPEKTRQRHPFAYIPFSAGHRNCIGQKFALMEEKTILSSILRNFKIEAIEEKPLILQELTLKPVNGLLVKLTPRKSC